MQNSLTTINLQYHTPLDAERILNDIMYKHAVNALEHGDNPEEVKEELFLLRDIIVKTRHQE